MHALLLTARKLVRQAVGAIAHVHQLNNLAGPGVAGRLFYFLPSSGCRGHYPIRSDAETARGSGTSWPRGAARAATRTRLPNQARWSHPMGFRGRRSCAAWLMFHSPRVRTGRSMPTIQEKFTCGLPVVLTGAAPEGGFLTQFDDTAPRLSPSEKDASRSQRGRRARQRASRAPSDPGQALLHYPVLRRDYPLPR